jgi:hypothetical protein
MLRELSFSVPDFAHSGLLRSRFAEDYMEHISNHLDGSVVAHDKLPGAFQLVYVGHQYFALRLLVD